MRHTLLFLFALLLAVSGKAQLQQIVAEPVEISAPSVQPEGTVTYRVYAEFGSPTDRLSAVFALEGCHTLDVSTTTTFYNNEFGGTTASSIVPALFGTYPSLEADSWLTIGAENGDSPGADDIFLLENEGDPFTESFGSSGSGASFSLNDGAWFTLASSAAGVPSGPMNRILLGQFTTDGELSFNLNLQVFVAGDQENGRVDYVWNDGCSEPTGFESLNTSLSQSVPQPALIDGCTDPEALNFDPAATSDDGSCIVPGCPDAPLNETYCYGNNDASVFTYTSTVPGEQVIIEFTAGSLESCCDALLIYDGIGTDGDLLGEFTGDLTDLLVTSNSGVITLVVDSDVSASCASGSQTEWNYNVYCGEEALVGCTDTEALNFDPEANLDDGSCILPDCSDEPVVFNYCYDSDDNSLFSYTALTPGGQVVIEFTAGTLESCCDDLLVYDGLGTEGTLLGTFTGSLQGVVVESLTGAITLAVDSDGSISCASGGHDEWVYNVYCGEEAVPGCTDSEAINFNAEATVDDGSCLFSDCTPESFTYCYGNNELNTFTYVADAPGDDIVVLFTAGSFESCCDEITVYDGVGTDGDVLGVVTGELSGTGFTATTGAITLLVTSDGSVSCTGLSQDELAYDIYCATEAIVGCTDDQACNFNPDADLDDGSCVLCPDGLCVDITVIPGDFPEEITFYVLDSEGNTVYSGAGLDGPASLCLTQGCYTIDMFDEWGDGWNDGALVVTVDGLPAGNFVIDTAPVGDGDEFGQDYLDVGDSGDCPVFGCTDILACNFNPEATDDDGSCEFPEEFFDCDGNCLNDADDDGVCDELEVPGCTDIEACNFVAEATDDDGSCTYPEEDYLDCDGNCLNDADDDGICDELEVPGCTDVEACNYVAEATDDDGSCEYAEEFFDCDGNCLNDADDDGICDELEVPGCTDVEACNYVAEATDDDGSCEYAEEFFDCDGNCLNDADNDGICDELEVPGCTDPEACNYDPEATDDDDSCEYIEEFVISGEGNPVEGSIETYTYEDTPGSSYDWVVTGGFIVSGQGTNEISVQWDTPGAGSVVVVETNELDCEGPPVTFVVTIQEDVSVEETMTIELGLWPNPANESITVEPGVNGLFELQILDATGREVFRTSINGRTVVPTAALSNGNYILRLTGTGAVATERFSVVR